MERLYKKLESYGQSDYYPFHMPGHKRNRASSADDFLFERDITEISGFDNLHHAEGILKEAQEYAAQIYGTKKCFFSVNGSPVAQGGAAFPVEEGRIRLEVRMLRQPDRS